MIFYLGTHQPHWLWRLAIPMFVSRRTLCKRRSFFRARARWALDSGGFSELSMFGEWQTPAKQYVNEVLLWNGEIGNLDWPAVQDWMCEPFIIQKTGLSVLEHQRRTIDSYKRLKDLAPEIAWTPVVQGYHAEEYFRHVDMYISEGIDLFKLPVVGVGSICRRQHTREAEYILKQLAGMGINIHGFGLKLLGLDNVAAVLHSADSLAWSFAARKDAPLPGHTHKNCANCSEYALLWRDRVLAMIDNAQLRPFQIPLPLYADMEKLP